MKAEQDYSTRRLYAADPNQLEMAILNLAVNARDAMPDGGQLTIAATDEILGSRHRSKLPVGHYVRLSVSDTGMAWMRGRSPVRSSRSSRPRTSAGIMNQRQLFLCS